MDNRRCVNTLCSIRMSCARAYDEDFNGDEQTFNGGSENGIACSAFILRKALGRNNPDMVLTEARRRGKRHNAHANIAPRTEFPGATALFGRIFTGAKGARKGRSKVVAQDDNARPLPKRPDLMVSRHIRDGRNIKED